MEDYMTAEQAASMLKLHVKHVQALARAGRLPGRRIGRKWLFSRAELESRLGGPERARADRPAPSRARVEISGRNQLRGTVTAVELGDVMAEVRARIGDQEVVSIITRSSAERLGLKGGSPVLVIVKATDVMLGRP